MNITMNDFKNADKEIIAMATCRHPRIISFYIILYIFINISTIRCFIIRNEWKINLFYAFRINGYRFRDLYL